LYICSYIRIFIHFFHVNTVEFLLFDENREKTAVLREKPGSAQK